MTEPTLDTDLTVNGERRRLSAPVRSSLAHALRDAGLVSVRLGCEQGVCGTCTVLLDGQPVRACLVLAAQASGGQVDTVEGLAAADALSVEQEALLDHRGLQCGFCTSGFLMLLAWLRRQGITDPAAVREALSANLCRCTGYRGILAAGEAVTAGRPAEQPTLD